MENQYIPVITHGIMATVPHPTDPDQLLVIHFVGFESEPDEEDFIHIYAELKTDPEFELTDVDFDLHHATQPVIDHFLALANSNDPDVRVQLHGPSENQ